VTPVSREAIDYGDIVRSGELLKGRSVLTPLVENGAVSQMAGKRVLVKAENLQLTGSFKFRGAWSAVSQLTADEAQRGVLAYSSGNHAQGVAMAAKLFGTSATIIMPGDAPRMKIDNTRKLGAEIILYDRPAGQDREAIGKALARDRQLTVIKPYDNPHVMAGQGTVGVEIAAQASDVGVTEAHVLVCCGGGGLTSGIAIALEQLAPDFLVRPVEPEAGDDVVRSLISGQRESNDGLPDSICDAIVTPSPGELTFPILKRLSGPGITVTDDDVLRAMAIAANNYKLVAEPGGAVALAAALNGRSEIASDTVICVISGGNVDPSVLANAIAKFG
jgi:threonine dehydratase